MMAVIRKLIAKGRTITLDDLAVLSPSLTSRIQRFGLYAIDAITLTTEPQRVGSLNAGFRSKTLCTPDPSNESLPSLR